MIFLGENLPIPDDPGFFLTHPLRYGFRDRVILFSMLLAVVLGSLAWAIFIRKPHRRHRRHYHYPNQGARASAPPREKGLRRPLIPCGIGVAGRATIAR